MKNDKLYKSDYKRKKKAINKLRFLLLRVWFYKNWFTLLVVVTGILVAATVTGIMPINIPIIGKISNAIKQYFNEFLRLGEEGYMSLFGSLTGIFSIFFALGYLSSNIKHVSYSMINKTKINKILEGSKLTMTEMGKIVTLETRIEMDLNGDNKIGKHLFETPERENIVNDIINTFDELSTILSIEDEILHEVNEKHSIKNKEKEETIEVVDRKPSTKYRPPGF